MSIEKQIEEMAKVIHDSDIADINTFPISMSECLARHGARRTGAAIALVNAGYSMQSEGEWEMKVYPITSCSVCGSLRSVEHQQGWNFCPNCGAKMKGGAE